MSKFLYWQAASDGVWHEALASTRQAIIESKRPQFITVLDLSELVTDSMTREQLAGLKYAGPLYFDFDHEDIRVTIEKAGMLVERFNSMGLDLNSVRWYATGGRGFHVEVPLACALAKVPAQGIALLPLIYREMAYELYIDSMDLRVYSAKRGRMWRTPNVQRDNGKYKVPITALELLEMTPEGYEAITSQPREPIETTAPELNADLALLYEKARTKVESAARAKAKVGQRDTALLQRFKGDWPPTLIRIMQGEGVAPGAGFHQLAMQIAITAHALGKTEEETLRLSEGLIETHVSDGRRYNSPSRRRAELSRLYAYCADNVCYSYSAGALKVLCAPDTDTSDLDGMPGDAGANLAPVQDGADKDSLDLRGGLEMRETGVFKKDQEQGIVMISDISFRDCKLLKSMPVGDQPAELWGYETEVLLKGQSRGRQMIDAMTFLSKQRYQEFAMKNMGVMKGGDNDVASLVTILRDVAVKSDNVVWVTQHEGLDYIVRPETKPPVRDLVWVEASGVYGGGEDRPPYTFRSQEPAGSLYRSDLMSAPLLTGAANEREFFRNLFMAQDGSVLGPMLGWFTACFHRMIYAQPEFGGQFPLCQVWGQAGSGKTGTTLLLAHMHYYSVPPGPMQCSKMTPYSVDLHCTSSVSIPLILDEYKPREIQADRLNALMGALRASYNNGTHSKGGGGSGNSGQGWKSLMRLTYSAPIIYISEAAETEPATMERTISIPVEKSGIQGRMKYFAPCQKNAHVLSSLGRGIVQATLKMDMGVFEEQFQKSVDEVTEIVEDKSQYRVIKNLAILLTGFDFFSAVLRSYFGTEFDSDLTRLRESIFVRPLEVASTIQAEAGKVLNAIAYMTNHEDSGDRNFGLREGVDYAFVSYAGTPAVELRMNTAYVKYAAWCRAKGQKVLYDNFEAFCSGLAHWAPTLDTRCLGSSLKDTGLTKVYCFSEVKLAEEGVEQFRKS